MKRCLGSHARIPAWQCPCCFLVIGCACDDILSATPIHTRVHTLSTTGGVVVISHHAEFTSAICSETWHVANGQLTITKKSADEEGEAEADGEAAHA